MRKSLSVVTVLALLAAASVSALCHAKDESKKEAATEIVAKPEGKTSPFPPAHPRPSPISRMICCPPL